MSRDETRRNGQLTYSAIGGRVPFSIAAPGRAGLYDWRRPLTATVPETETQITQTADDNDR